MKLLYTFIFIFLGFCTMTNAQSLLWAKSIGGANNDDGRSVAFDAIGNVYTTGSFNGTVDFDPGAGIFNLTSAGDADVYITKLDPTGSFLWAKSMGGTTIDVGYAITVDASGNIYTTGTFQGSADFDPGIGTSILTMAGGYDIFISKLDLNGDFLWAKAMGGSTVDFSYAIAVDISGNIYTTGYFQGTADFDPGASTYNLTSAGLSDIFISKLDYLGNFVWAGAMGGPNNDYGRSLTIDPNGDVFTTGSFEDTADFDPGVGTSTLISTGLKTIFVSKINTAGNFVWVKAMGGTINNQGYGIALDQNGNILTTGSFDGTVDFDPGAGIVDLTSQGNLDIFISKLDPSGNLLWAKSMGGISSDEGFSIAADIGGNVCLTGYFKGTADFDPGASTFNLNSSGQLDMFVAKLDPLGNFLWAKAMGGANYEEGLSIKVDAGGNIYATGDFNGTADFDPDAGILNLSPIGGFDMFTLKLNGLTGFEDVSQSSSSVVYPNPSNGIIHFSNFQYPNGLSHIEIYNSLGEIIFSQIPDSNADQMTVDLSNQPTGIYFATIQNGEEIIYKKIIIAK
ncbi:hypothetical protein BH09BAC5_BH09BAC5_12850 [soil metagenome]